jgi:hypothetical protein
MLELGKPSPLDLLQLAFAGSVAKQLILMVNREIRPMTEDRERQGGPRMAEGIMIF